MVFGCALWLDRVISPVLITILLVFVSGVPLTEKRFEGRFERTALSFFSTIKH